MPNTPPLLPTKQSDHHQQPSQRSPSRIQHHPHHHSTNMPAPPSTTSPKTPPQTPPTLPSHPKPPHQPPQTTYHYTPIIPTTNPTYTTSPSTITRIPPITEMARNIGVHHGRITKATHHHHPHTPDYHQIYNPPPSHLSYPPHVTPHVTRHLSTPPTPHHPPPVIHPTQQPQLQTPPGSSSSSSSTPQNLQEKDLKELERKRCHQEQTRRSRQKMNDKILKIKEELPDPPCGVEVRHKAQILDYCIQVMKGYKEEIGVLRVQIGEMERENWLLKEQLRRGPMRGGVVVHGGERR